MWGHKKWNPAWQSHFFTIRLRFFDPFMLFLLVLVGFLSTCNQNGGFPDKNGENLKSHVGTFKVDETQNLIYWVSRHFNLVKILINSINHWMNKFFFIVILISCQNKCSLRRFKKIIYYRPPMIFYQMKTVYAYKFLAW